MARNNRRSVTGWLLRHAVTHTLLPHLLLLKLVALTVGVLFIAFGYIVGLMVSAPGAVAEPAACEVAWLVILTSRFLPKIAAARAEERERAAARARDAAAAAERARIRSLSPESPATIRRRELVRDLRNCSETAAGRLLDRTDAWFAKRGV